jgi:thiol:disulfide interchange protein DsbD
MRTFRMLFIFAALAFAGGSALGQSSADAVKLAPALSVDKVKQGSAFQAAVVVNVENGYHINSNHPTDTFLIGTALKLEKADGITAGLVRYPKPTLKKFSFSPKPLSVYEGRAVLKFSATAAPGISAGSHTIHAKLTVQACSDQACLIPKTVDVDIPFEVVPASAQVNNINGDIFGSPGARKH